MSTPLPTRPNDETPERLRRRTRRHRTEQQLRDTLSMLAEIVWTGTARPGAHVWSIPPDEERDWDCILHDAVDELLELRTAADATPASDALTLLRRCRDAFSTVPPPWSDAWTNNLQPDVEAALAVSPSPAPAATTLGQMFEEAGRRCWERLLHEPALNITTGDVWVIQDHVRAAFAPAVAAAEAEIARLREENDNLRHQLSTQLDHRRIADDALSDIAKAIGYTGPFIQDIPGILRKTLAATPTTEAR